MTWYVYSTKSQNTYLLTCAQRSHKMLFWEISKMYLLTCVPNKVSKYISSGMCAQQSLKIHIFWHVCPMKSQNTYLLTCVPYEVSKYISCALCARQSQNTYLLTCAPKEVSKYIPSNVCPTKSQNTYLLTCVPSEVSIYISCVMCAWQSLKIRIFWHVCPMKSQYTYLVQCSLDKVSKYISINMCAQLKIHIFWRVPSEVSKHLCPMKSPNTYHLTCVPNEVSKYISSDMCAQWSLKIHILCRVCLTKVSKYIPSDVYLMKTQISLHIHTIRSVFVVPMKKLCLIGYPKCPQWRFWTDCGCAGWFESFLGAHVWRCINFLTWQLLKCNLINKVTNNVIVINTTHQMNNFEIYIFNYCHILEYLNMCYNKYWICCEENISRSKQRGSRRGSLAQEGV